MALSVNLFGCGTIEQEIARAFADGTVNADLTYVYDRNRGKRRAVLDAFRGEDAPEAVEEVTALFEGTDLVVEAAGHSAVADVAIPSLEADCDVLVMSVGAFADTDLRRRIIRIAEREDRIVHVPLGPIASLNAVKVAALTGDLESVSLTTTRNPAGLEGTPYFVENGIDVDGVNEAMTVFEGTATEVARAFPSNINVAMALSLAGIGPNETGVHIVADLKEGNNVHRIEATGEIGTIETTVRDVPSPTNPKTSYLVAVSAIQKLQTMGVTVRVGA